LVEQTDKSVDTMLLLTLGEVSELVAHSHDLTETLTNIVHNIRRRFATDVCSVYVVDNRTGELVLSATVGLRNESVNRVRMRPNEGLTGLVAERKAPVAVDNAPSHPRYRYFPESGEEEFHSFLGVPLIAGGGLQGVLVVQHREPRAYSANEVRMLVAVAAQLAILVANARLTRELSQAVHQKKSSRVGAPAKTAHRLMGTPASHGLAIGTALRFEEFDFDDPKWVARRPEGALTERARLMSAIEHGRSDIDRAARHLAELLGDQFGALMQAQRLMLEDSTLQRDLLQRIEEGASVERAVVTVCGQYLKAFQKLDSPMFYERIYDIKDVFRRVLACSTAESAKTTG
jgi:phosphotransferase system enzyme I (PtsP)